MTPGDRAKHWARLMNEMLFSMKKLNLFLLVRNIQKSEDIFTQFWVPQLRLLWDQAQSKEDCIILPENVVLESWTFYGHIGLIRGKMQKIPIRRTPLPRVDVIFNTLGPGPEYWFLLDWPPTPRDLSHSLRPGPMECCAVLYYCIV